MYLPVNEFLWVWTWPLTTIAAACFAAFWVWIAFRLREELQRVEQWAAELHARATHWRSEFERVDADYAAFASAVVRGPVSAPAAAEATPQRAPATPPVLVPADPVQYVVLHVRRDEILDSLRAWAAQAVTLLPLVPTTPAATNQLATLVSELQALIHRLDGDPSGVRMEPPITPEARVSGNEPTETTMPTTQIDRAVTEEDLPDELDIPDEDVEDEDFDESDDESDEDEDFDEDDFDDDDDDDFDDDDDDLDLDDDDE